MDNIIIVGSSGHAKVVIDIVNKAKRYNIVGLLDRFRHVGENVLDCNVLGKEEDLFSLINRHKLKGIIVAVGDNYVRSQIVEHIESLNLNIKFVTAIHPCASIAANVTIGLGTVIMAGVTINPGCSIAHHCILNSNCSLDHDSIMDDFSSLAPGVMTGGNCRIGKSSAICIGTVLSHKVSIGKSTVVGAGSLVMQNVDSFVVAYGRPAKVVRSRKRDDTYL
jgi:sugar O-acyltransferase (sialic acid O-acetyltransferase NeuD family)